MSLLKVKHSELSNVKDVMKNNGEELGKCIDEYLTELEKLREVWQGEDSDKFYSNVLQYFTKMKLIPATMSTIGSFIGTANGKYEENDNSFSRELQTEVDDYEQQDRNN